MNWLRRHPVFYWLCQAALLFAGMIAIWILNTRDKIRLWFNI